MGSEVGTPAEVHEAQQVVIRGLLDEVVDVSLDGQRQSHHFIPVLDDALQPLLDVQNVSLSLRNEWQFRVKVKMHSLAFLSETPTLTSKET